MMAMLVMMVMMMMPTTTTTNKMRCEREERQCAIWWTETAPLVSLAPCGGVAERPRFCARTTMHTLALTRACASVLTVCASHTHTHTRQIGIPAGNVKQRMTTDGINPDILDTPDGPSPNDPASTAVM
jgi:hypothetical protein